MKHLLSLIAASLLAFFSLASAQQPQTPEEQEKQLMEYIDKEVERLSNTLKMEYWQEFYADSVLVHDFHAMQDELKELQASKVTNADMYQQVQDKWSENIYNAFHKFLNEDQWKKYLKGGAARDKKARDKRAEKALKAAAELKNGGK